MDLILNGVNLENSIFNLNDQEGQDKKAFFPERFQKSNENTPLECEL